MSLSNWAMFSRLTESPRKSLARRVSRSMVRASSSSRSRATSEVSSSVRCVLAFKRAGEGKRGRVERGKGREGGLKGWSERRMG